ncbi:2OG-Fe(II) oxygenase [Bradyrhizobium sp. CIAT3101]|uniref:2OG-Fe(II) oxygenase n=1 Tax=Bradyrhizobium sp. CIAT3101 TaxID=439387 RepID=UPI0024B257F1|nr:2OG-Fe(II) oxygenase [Bradyrhizobium sp. CIAT3101]WFU79158.1 2OG-Fe(II) oxygenase [Bradyrhizobium sp. CIAT3101]
MLMRSNIERSDFALDGKHFAAAYRQARPFPHIALKNFWDPEQIAEVSRQVKRFSFFDGEKDFYATQKKRYCGTYEKMPPAVRNLIDTCHSSGFVKFLEDMTGESDLVGDPQLAGGGIHSSTTSGFLKVHADFNWNEQLGLYRRLNLLVYLNSGWEAAWGGSLELWSRDMSRKEASIVPDLNTVAIFSTDESSYHGHPDPLSCPEGVTRDSIALYYYSPAKPTDAGRAKRGISEYRSRGISDLLSSVKFKLIDKFRGL